MTHYTEYIPEKFRNNPRSVAYLLYEYAAAYNASLKEQMTHKANDADKDTRKCLRCFTVKSLDKFRSTESGRLRRICKLCEVEVNKLYRSKGK